jgi:hypothetical protein
MPIAAVPQIDQPCQTPLVAHQSTSRRSSWAVRLVFSIMLVGAGVVSVLSIESYRQGATSTTSSGATLVWCYVFASVGLLAIALALQMGAPRGRAFTVAVAGAAIAAAFALFRPDVEAHASSDGLWVFGPLIGLGLNVVLAGVMLLARFGDSSWWRDQPHALRSPHA